MNFDLMIREGFSAIKIGLPRSVIRDMLTGHDLTIQDREPNTDFYTDLGLLTSYDDDNELEFVELAAPARVYFCKINLLGIMSDDAFILINKVIDEHPAVEFGSFIYRKNCLGFKISDDRVESVCIFKSGYL